ncbi:MAG: hypothetical protein JWL95_1138 [Gemmatimonadetes bacterium]|nr:hypothetical protein [Gemmatimonadota bacterium]
MFFRGKQPEASIWRRFRASSDGFTFTEEEGVYTAHVVANAERVVDLFWNLSEMLSPAVDLYVDDLRSGRKWKGEALPLPDVRDTVARLKLLLARFGGVEMSVYTPEDQLALNPHLELFIYSKSDKWLYLLEGRGLEEQSRVRSKSWRIKRQGFPAAPDLVNAVATAAERLGLQRV